MGGGSSACTELLPRSVQTLSDGVSPSEATQGQVWTEIVRDKACVRFLPRQLSATCCTRYFEAGFKNLWVGTRRVSSPGPSETLIAAGVACTVPWPSDRPSRPLSVVKDLLRLFKPSHLALKCCDVAAQSAARLFEIYDPLF